MKCNPHPAIMDFFISMPGISFDCASIGEITTCIKGGVPANRIVFANPIKVCWMVCCLCIMSSQMRPSSLCAKLVFGVVL